MKFNRTHEKSVDTFRAKIKIKIKYANRTFKYY